MILHSSFLDALVTGDAKIYNPSRRTAKMISKVFQSVIDIKSALQSLFNPKLLIIYCVKICDFSTHW